MVLYLKQNPVQYLLIHSVSTTKMMEATNEVKSVPYHRSKKYLGQSTFRTSYIIVSKKLVHFWETPLFQKLSLWLWEKVRTWTTQMFPIWRKRKPMCLYLILVPEDHRNLFSGFPSIINMYITLSFYKCTLW